MRDFSRFGRIIRFKARYAQPEAIMLSNRIKMRFRLITDVFAIRTKSVAYTVYLLVANYFGHLSSMIFK